MKLVPRGLRVRSALGFAVLALMVSAMLSLVTYQLARWYLIGQREDLAVRQTMVNAQVAKGLVASTEDPESLLSSLRSVSNARAVLSVNGSWYATVVEFNEAVIPASERDEVAESGAAMQRVSVNGAPYLVIGVELPGLDAVYFEFVSLAEYRDTVDTLATTLFIGAGVATLGGAIVGWLLSRRVLRPLSGVADAAAAIASGQLDRRLDGAHDPDLQPVVDSFNEMASSLESRIAREVR
ncbi:MAG: HAMP domain-containing protein, partial [Ilumatobacter sp.]|nr:HAMP domain-containing protein [Ilumatobacter sp.]